MHDLLESLRDLRSHALWALIGSVGTFAWTRLSQVRRTRGQAALFRGLEPSHPGETVFVYPPRHEYESPPDTASLNANKRGDPGTASLPLTYIEDFMAMNNLVSAFLAFGGKPPDKFRDFRHLSELEKKSKNLILICSSRSNKATEDAIAALRKKGVNVPYFEEDKTAKDSRGRPRVNLRWKSRVESPSYDQEAQNLGLPESARTTAFDDVALIVKAANPWAPDRKILIVAGVRGFGTWGAAEMLKKWWRDIYDEKKSSWRRSGPKKSGDFWAIVDVRIDQHDIQPSTVRHLEDLDKAR